MSRFIYSMDVGFARADRWFCTSLPSLKGKKRVIEEWAVEPVFITILHFVDLVVPIFLVCTVGSRILRWSAAESVETRE